MLVKIKRHYCLRLGLDVAPGDIVQVTATEAAQAFALDRAEPYAGDEPPAEAPAPGPQAAPRKRTWSRR